MNTAELLTFLKQGGKATHRHFSPDEWMIMNNGKLEFEDGVRCSWHEFWKYRQDIGMSEGWTDYEIQQ